MNLRERTGSPHGSARVIAALGGGYDVIAMGQAARTLASGVPAARGCLGAPVSMCRPSDARHTPALGIAMLYITFFMVAIKCLNQMRSLDETSTAAPLVKRESIVERILQTVAAIENVPTTELPPLFDVVDPDALSAVFSSPPGGPSRNQGTVTFPYVGYQVTVRADGSVEAERRRRPPKVD